LNDIKVYSNMPSVELELNGVSLGSKTGSNGVFAWPDVPLAIGANTIQATGTSGPNSYSDSVRWTMQPKVRIDVGGRRSYIDTAGRWYASDTYGSGGTTESTTHPIGSTDDDVVYQSYRSGAFGYGVPVDNGQYRVGLEFVEPDWQAPGKRVFNVIAERTPVLTNFDIYAAAGYLNAIVKTVTVTVTDGILNVSFSPSIDDAIVSGITLVKQ
jgi:beta-galactosidase